MNKSTRPTASEKINSFADLQEGWDHGYGGPIPEKILDVAREWDVFLSAQAFSYTDAFPGDDGKITIAAGVGDYYIEVIIESDLTVSVAYDFQRKQKFYRLRMSREGAVDSVLEVLGEICSVSTSSTKRSLIQRKTSLSETLLSITGDRYLLSGLTASTTLGTQYAYTLESTMGIWANTSSATPRYFGGSIQMSSQRAAA